MAERANRGISQREVRKIVPNALNRKGLRFNLLSSIFRSIVAVSHSLYIAFNSHCSHRTPHAL